MKTNIYLVSNIILFRHDDIKRNVNERVDYKQNLLIIETINDYENLECSFFLNLTNQRFANVLCY